MNSEADLYKKLKHKEYDLAKRLANDSDYKWIYKYLIEKRKPFDPDNHDAAADSILTQIRLHGRATSLKRDLLESSMNWDIFCELYLYHYEKQNEQTT